MDQSLYELTQDYLALQELDDDEAVLDTIEGLKGTIQVKSINVAKYIGNLEASAVAIDNAMKQMAERKKILGNKAVRIRKYLKDSMEANKIHEIHAPEFDLKIKKCPPKLIVGDEDLIPKKYKKIERTTTIDKASIKKTLSSGKAVSGARLEQSTRLEIK